MVLDRHCSETLKTSKLPSSVDWQECDKDHMPCSISLKTPFQLLQKAQALLLCQNIYTVREIISASLWISHVSESHYSGFFIEFFLTTVNNKHLILFSIFNKICYTQLVKPRVFRSLVLDWIFCFWIEKQRCCLFNLFSGLSQFPVWRNVLQTFTSVYFIF